MGQQIRRWLRCFFTLQLVMWLLLLKFTDIDSEVTLLISKKEEPSGGDVQDREPHQEQEKFLWRNPRQEDIEGNMVVTLRNTTIQNKDTNTATEDPTRSTMLMTARVTGDLATAASAEQEGKAKRQNNIKYGRKDTRRERKMKGLETKKKSKRKVTKIGTRQKRRGSRSRKGISQEIPTNSNGFRLRVGGTRQPQRSVLTEGERKISKHEGTTEPILPNRTTIIPAVEPQKIMIDEEPKISREKILEMQAKEPEVLEERKEIMRKESEPTRQFQETELHVEGIPKAAVEKGELQTEKTNISSVEPKMQENEENMFAEEERRIPEQELRIRETGDPKIITEGKVLPDGRNSSLNIESLKPRSNATQTSPALHRILKNTRKVSNIKISHEIDKMEVSLTDEQIEDVRERVREANEAQEILNEQVFGPVFPNTTVLLVQVHKRLENLRYLVESMEAVQGINESLVIFSHDLWDPAINAFVRNITSFRALQIFFPFSIQLYPRSFPGIDPRDCAWNSTRTRLLGDRKCQGQPDTYGHYREAPLSQIKHHWWWKINRVFGGLRVMRESTGWVVFLEEDHYLAPDLLYVLQLLLQEKSLLCQYCQIISLGNYVKVKDPIFSMLVTTGNWKVTHHNLGFALDRATWGIIKSCQEFFCNFDDYNWDWTLFRLVQTCSKPKLAMLAVTMSRVHHIGSCGTHIKKKTCDIESEVESVRRHFQAYARSLFPVVFKVYGLFKYFTKHIKPNGGWGDHRDHQLCQDMANSFVSENTLLKLHLSDEVLKTNHPDAET